MEFSQFLRYQGYNGRYREYHKFGRVANLGATYTPVCLQGTLYLPVPSAATRLRVKAGNAADTAAGAGARIIRIDYLDVNCHWYTEYLDTAGASPSAWTSRDVFRLISFRVQTSGTYWTPTTASHVGDIVLEDETLTEAGTISITDFARGRSQIGFFSIPQFLKDGAKVQAAYVTEFTLSVASNKTVDFLYFERPGNDDEANYRGGTILEEFTGVSGQFESTDEIPRGPFLPGTDIGFMAKAATSANAGVSLEFLLATEA